MQIVVLGATGRTGRLVVEQALMRGDEVVAYVRNPHGIAENPGLEIAVGQLGDRLALKAVINGADAVLACLGTHGKRMKKNIDLMQKSVPSIINAMKEANASRLVLESAYGVGDTARTAGLIDRGPLADAVEVRPMTQVHNVAGLPKVSRADVARVMLDAARDDRTIGQKLLVSRKGSVR
jgi:putative NADH-flavin reductase